VGILSCLISLVKDFFVDFVDVSDVQSEDVANKGARNYALDEDGRVIGLSLDSSAVHLFCNTLLKELPHLRFLSLRFNAIPDVSFLTELKNLSSLHPGNAKLTDISALNVLKNLSSLDVSYNNLTDISVLKQLKNLSSLNISSNNLTDVSVLGHLKNLLFLDVSKNPVKTPKGNHTPGS
jgi:Leucine-rich repeat (LRR) protein